MVSHVNAQQPVFPTKIKYGTAASIYDKIDELQLGEDEEGAGENQ